MLLKYYPYILIILFLFSNEIKSQIVIQDSLFSATLDLNGPSWNNAIIRNCTFSDFILSDGLRIANVSNVIIDNCTFKNIQGNGIRFHNFGVSNGVIIQNCVFDSIYGNGINSSEGHINTQIINNDFNNIGLDLTGSSVGEPHHGIYFQGGNFIISNNRISNIINPDGNCISVRSNGIVRNNVLFNSTKNGISYYSDHPSVENVLLVENNIVYKCQRGVNIADGGEQYVDSTIIRFNTFITENKMCVSIGSGLKMNIHIYGNIFIRNDGSSNYIFADSPYDSSKNVLSGADIGFVDYSSHDYHITDKSKAYSFATGLSDYPIWDFENDLRESSRLDAGADQIKSVSGIHSNNIIDYYHVNKNINLFPNPANTTLYIQEQSEHISHYDIINILGQTLQSGMVKNGRIDVSNLPQGIYFLKSVYAIQKFMVVR